MIAKQNPSLKKTLVTLLLVGIAALVQYLQRPPVSEGSAAIDTAFKNERSGVIVEASGRVAKVLPDDREGDRHQRFIIRIAGGHSLLVAHNIDVAERAPVKEGDLVKFRGQYEWSEQGGTLHWTHHDRAGRHADGWIEVNGRRVQ